MALVSEIYRHTQRFPKDEIYGLSSQLRRAVVSIPSNIAEGQGRRLAKSIIDPQSHSRMNLEIVDVVGAEPRCRVGFLVVRTGLLTLGR